MPRIVLVLIAFICGLLQQACWCFAEPLTVSSNFEGASVSAVEIDEETGTISFMPGGDPSRGWPCWWYFRIDGIEQGEKVTLRLRGSTAAVGKQKPLSAVWAMPKQATYSVDGETWLHTADGKREDEWMIYTLEPEAESVFVAWGPPYTPETATQFVQAMDKKSPHAKADQLCRSRQDRPVPMLHVMEGELPAKDRFGVWVQARQHAWESGSSWVAQGFAEWLLGEDEQAAWLRQHAEIFIVPIMDVDNVAAGNGGKNELPHDHNRDWKAEPHWNEVIAAQRQVSKLIDEERMSIFLDLHNPGPGDPTFFFILAPDLIQEPMISLQNRFVELAYARISKCKPFIPMSNTSKPAGASYHPLWRQISSNWVGMNGNPDTVSLCLETIWNHKNSTPVGYRAVGSNLALAVSDYLTERSKMKD